MKRILFVFSCIFTISCNEKHNNPIASLSLIHNSIDMKIGDSWLYKRLFINLLYTGKTNFPDTLIGYSYFAANKDTIINGKEYLIIDGKDYEVEKETISTYYKRCAIHISDSISIYEFKTGYVGFFDGVFKCKKNAAINITKNNFGTLILKKALMQKIGKYTNYDTTIFRDFVYPMIYPLVEDSIYVYRDSADPIGNYPYRRKFMGIENVSISLGQFQAYKYEWMTKEALGLDSIYIFDWIGKNGLLKRFISSGKNDITDELGVVTGRVQSYEIYELIGKNDINIDTLKPWGKP